MTIPVTLTKIWYSYRGQGNPTYWYSCQYGKAKMRIKNKPTESADLSVEPIQNVQKEEIIRQKLRITKLIQPGVKQKIILAARMFEKKVTSSERDVDFYRLAIDAVRSQFLNLSDLETDTLVWLVMFTFWQSEEEDLKELLEEMNRMNQVKKGLREYITFLKKQKAKLEVVRGEFKDSKIEALLIKPQTQIPRVKTLPKMAITRHLKIKYPKTPEITIRDLKKRSLPELEKEKDDQESKLKSLGKLSEKLKLIIQIQMERRAKITQALSNILKKISQTSDSIIQNIK